MTKQQIIYKMTHGGDDLVKVRPVELALVSGIAKESISRYGLGLEGCSDRQFIRIYEAYRHIANTHNDFSKKVEEIIKKDLQIITEGL